MVKGYSLVNEAEADFFLEPPSFFHDPTNVGDLISFFLCLFFCLFGKILWIETFFHDQDIKKEVAFAASLKGKRTDFSRNGRCFLRKLPVLLLQILQPS